jgi:hypothetical protein
VIVAGPDQVVGEEALQAVERPRSRDPEHSGPLRHRDSIVEQTAEPVR